MFSFDAADYAAAFFADMFFRQQCYTLFCRFSLFAEIITLSLILSSALPPCFRAATLADDYGYYDTIQQPRFIYDATMPPAAYFRHFAEIFSLFRRRCLLMPIFLFSMMMPPFRFASRLCCCHAAAAAAFALLR